LIIGVIANAARHEPEAVAALRAGRDDTVNRLLRLPLPQPYRPTRTEALRDRLRSRKPKAAAKAARKPAKDNRRKPDTADRPVRRSGHHGGGQRAHRGREERVRHSAREERVKQSAAGQQRHQGRRARTLEGQRHG
jgi:cell division protein FtsW